MTTARSWLAGAVLLSAAGGGLVLLAAGRTWAVETVARPAPMPAEELAWRGGELVSWLPALGWVAVAGAGALLATRGVLRRGLGGLLALAGAGAISGVVLAAAEVGGGLPWAVAGAAGGLAVVGAGLLTVAAGHRWPAMGARYERDAGRRSRQAGAPAGAAGSSEQWWDALDRGEDPTS